MNSVKMWVVLFLSLLLLAGCSTDESTAPENSSSESDIVLYINEFMASNDNAVTDENGEYDDWVELYNPGNEDINIGGFYVSDDLADLTMFQLPENDPATVVPAGGYLVLWFDGQPEQGALHVDPKLSSSGEDIVITEPNGISRVAFLTFGPQITDVSYGRTTDGGDEWAQFSQSTPGASNSEGSTNVAPVISSVAVAPDSLEAGVDVTVSAVVTDGNDNLASVNVSYWIASDAPVTMAMTASDSLYSANLGSFADGSKVYFYITATDSEDAVTVSDTLSFEVGYVPPVLYINEFLASNDSCLADEYGDYDDWIEIYNPGTEPVDIGGMYITDDLTDLTVWQIPSTAPDSTTVPAGGFLLLWADKESEQGVLHVELKLSSDGEQIGLVAPNGVTIIDSLTFGAQYTDTSYARIPDGGNVWEFVTTPTPGESNGSSK